MFVNAFHLFLDSSGETSSILGHVIQGLEDSNVGKRELDSGDVP